MPYFEHFLLFLKGIVRYSKEAQLGGTPVFWGRPGLDFKSGRIVMSAKIGFSRFVRFVFNAGPLGPVIVDACPVQSVFLRSRWIVGDGSCLQLGQRS